MSEKLGVEDVFVQAQAAALRVQLLGYGLHNKTQLGVALRGVTLLQGAEGAEPKLLAISKLHMLGEVLSALFERLQERDNKLASREDMAWTALHTERLAKGTHTQSHGGQDLMMR